MNLRGIRALHGFIAGLCEKYGEDLMEISFMDLFIVLDESDKDQLWELMK